MNLKIVTFTLIILLALSPTVQQVKAQVNETEPIPDGTNSTIPLPQPGNTTIGNFTSINTTIANTTIPYNNTTYPDDNNTKVMSEPISMETLTNLQTQFQSSQEYMLQLLGNTTLSSEIANGMMHAQQAMDKAMLFEGNNSRAAAQQYLRAMKHQRNTLRKYIKDNPEVFISLETGNSTATEDLNMTATEAEISASKVQLINQFQERFQEQLTEMYQFIDEVSEDLSPEDVSRIQRAISKAEAKLVRIQEKILNGQFDEALDDLEDTTETLDEDVEESVDPGAAQMFKEMNRLQAKIEKLEQKAARKAARGENTGELDALLEELRNNRNKVKNAFKENKGKGKGNGKNKDKSNNGNNN